MKNNQLEIATYIHSVEAYREKSVIAVAHTAKAFGIGHIAFPWYQQSLVAWFPQIYQPDLDPLTQLSTLRFSNTRRAYEFMGNLLIDWIGTRGIEPANLNHTASFERIKAAGVLIPTEHIVTLSSRAFF